MVAAFAALKLELLRDMDRVDTLSPPDPDGRRLITDSKRDATDCPRTGAAAPPKKSTPTAAYSTYSNSISCNDDSAISKERHDAITLNWVP